LNNIIGSTRGGLIENLKKQRLCFCLTVPSLAGATTDIWTIAGSVEVARWEMPTDLPTNCYSLGVEEEEKAYHGEFTVELDLIEDALVKSLSVKEDEKILL